MCSVFVGDKGLHAPQQEERLQSFCQKDALREETCLCCSILVLEVALELCGKCFTSELIDAAEGEHYFLYNISIHLF